MRFGRSVAIGVVVALVMAAPAGAGVRHVATLSLSGGQVSGGIAPVAASDGLVVAGAGGSVYAFVRSSGGWVGEREAAVLSDSGGASLEPTGLAADGRVVVANEHLLSPDRSFEDVFVEPAGGWAGSVDEMARLVASDGAVLYAPSLSGTTVVAVGVVPQTQRSSAYVFVEPAGGWSGAVHEVAKLPVPGGQPLSYISSAAVSGRTVVVAHGQEADVYVEPADGWSPRVRTVARLRVPDFAHPAGISGRVVVAGHYVFTEPSRGWGSGAPRSGEVVPVGGEQWQPCEAMSAGAIACSVGRLGLEHGCPCTGTGWVFTQPTGGWTGALVAKPVVGAITETGDLPIAIDGRTLFTAGGSTIEVDVISGQIAHAPDRRPPPA
jgi:hypothetical protein